MREDRLLVALCGALTDAMGRKFIPETWRDGCVSVFLSGGGGEVRLYVDGSAVKELSVDIKMREVVRCEADRLRVLDVLCSIANEAVEITLDGGEIAKLCSVGLPKKTKTYENGSEEYTAPFILKYFTRSTGARKEKNEIYRKR